MSTISVYTMTTNSIRDEFCVVEGIKSALLFANEVVVMDGGSTDNTLDAIFKINDNRINVYVNEWLDSLSTGMYAINKSLSLGKCKSDWCVLMDSDEVFHEFDAEKIRKAADSVSSNIIAIKFNTFHFYKDYKHIINGVKEWKDLYTNKIYMVRNGLGIHHGNNMGDPDLQLLPGGKVIPPEKIAHIDISVFHYGHVRTKEKYLQKVNKLHKSFVGKDYVDVKNFEWLEDSKLGTFSGSHPKVMEARIYAGTDSHERIMKLYDGN